MMSMKIIVGRIVMKYKIECDYKTLKEIPTFDEITIKMTNGCPIRLLQRWTVYLRMKDKTLFGKSWKTTLL